MEFGIGYFPTHDAVGPGAVARLAEEHGHESPFFAEHTHIPANRETAAPAAANCRESTDLVLAQAGPASPSPGARRR